jgi:hypothetical protein
MLGMAFGDVTSRRRLYLVARSSHVVVNVDRLACPLHHPMAYCHHMRGQGFLSGTVFSCHVTASSGIFLGRCKALGLGYLMGR